LSKYVYVADRSEHLIPIQHIHHDGDRLWLVTPLADSLTGADTPNAYKAFSLANHLLARGRLSDREAVSIGLCLVRGLLALHHAGLLHGDVAPANILRIHGRWVLADPGLVRFLGEPGICRNRRYYPLPQPLRQNDDLYAVGVILWEMTSGLAEMQSGQERLSLDTRMLQFLLRSDLPLARLICRAAATAPEQRYMNGEEMLQDLEFVTARLPAEGSTYSLYNYPNLRALRTNGALPPLA
jgi:serine/threonine protein kinase